jgi:hypothetical protein
MKFKIIVLILLSTNLLKAQDREKDKLEIKNTIIGYIENFFLNRYDDMEKHLHARLSKRGIENNGMISEDYSKNDLKEMMTNKSPLPLAQQSNLVSGILIDRNFASAILETGYPTTRWKEYIHLAKLDGTWVIMDVFWIFD